MDSSPQQSFQERLSHWVASQGFWFQLRYSTAAGGGLGAVGVRFLSLMLRVVLVLALVAAGGWVYLVKRTDSPQFPLVLASDLQTTLSGQNAKVTGFQQSKGQGYIHNLQVKGTADSFFDQLEAREVRFQMDVLDGVKGTWNLGPLRLTSMDMIVKAGADSDEDAAKAIGSLFHTYQKHRFGVIEVTSANVYWGYSDKTRGSITGSRLVASKLNENTWKLEFKGGHISQNWIHGWAIDHLTVLCSRSGLQINEMVFRQGRGKLTGKLNVTSGAKPMWDGKLQMEALPLDSALPDMFSGMLEGSITGQLTVSGSTNSQEGLYYRGDLLIEKDDQVVLRDRIPLLRALSVVDSYNSYKRVICNSGSCSFSYGAGEIALTGVDFNAGDLMGLRGEIRMRPATEKEVEEALAKTGAGRSSTQTFLSAVDEEQQKIDQAKGNKGITLRDAATSRSGATGSEERAFSIFDQQNAAAQPTPQSSRERTARMPRYEGKLTVTLPFDVFQRAPDLQRIYPADPAKHRVALEVPLKGNLFDLTLEQAERLYEAGKPKL